MIILTGFGPFGKHTHNLSGDLVKSFPSEINKNQISKAILPVSWNESINMYNALLSSLDSKPKLAILMGIHPRTNIKLERIGWNWTFGRDIQGVFKFGFIKAGSPLRLKTVLDIKYIYNLIKNDMNIKISKFAGFYLCNYIYYWALNLSKHKYPVLFIHIPSNGELDFYINKIRVILRAIIESEAL